MASATPSTPTPAGEGRAPSAAAPPGRPARPAAALGVGRIARLVATRRPFVLAVTGLAALAAATSAVIRLALFADGSLNADEVAYLLQAEAITEGELFVAVPEPAEAFQPWFFVEGDAGFVSKYLPLVSALFAAGLWSVGSVTPVLALLAAVLPVLVTALAREVGLDRPAALAAGALVSLSPVTLVESALPLSYVAFLVLVTAAWLLVVRLAERRGGAGQAAALGLVATAAACARPYDAVLLVVPGVLWAARRRRGDLARLGAGLVAGALPLGVAVAAYDAAATGRPWRLPFSLLEPSDTIGFGDRRLVPEYAYSAFGPLRSLYGLGLHFGAGLVLWTALGLLLVPAAVAAWRGATGAARLLRLLVAVHLAGYALFWGPWNISIHWDGARRVLGPVYALPLLVLVVLLGLPVVARWSRRRPRLVGRLALAGAAVAVAQLGVALWQASIDERRTDAVLAAAERASAEGRLLLDVDPPYLGHPVTGLVEGVALAAAYPVPAGDEPHLLLQLPRLVYGVEPFSYAVTRQERVAGTAVGLDVGFVGREADVLVVERAGRAWACRLGAVAHVVLTAADVRGCGGGPIPRDWAEDEARRCEDRSCLAIAAFRERDGRLRRVAWRALPVETRGDRVALLVDGERVEGTGNGWLRVAHERPAGAGT